MIAGLTVAMMGKLVSRPLLDCAVRMEKVLVVGRRAVRVIKRVCLMGLVALLPRQSMDRVARRLESVGMLVVDYCWTAWLLVCAVCLAVYLMAGSVAGLDSTMMAAHAAMLGRQCVALPVAV